MGWVPWAVLVLSLSVRGGTAARILAPGSQNGVEAPLQGAAGAPHRDLLQVDEITVVTSSRGLMDAISAGAEHIEIQNHLQVNEIPGSARRSITHIFGDLPATMKSIRGNCVNVPEPAESAVIPPGHTPLLPLQRGQCLLLADQALWQVNNTQVWVDALYARIGLNRFGEEVLSLMKVVGSEAAAWLTGVTLQGNGDGALDCDVCGLHVTGGATVYAEDCILSSFDGVNAALADEAYLSFSRCTFANNTIFPRDSGAGVIEAKSFADPLPTGEVRLQGCTFTGNSGSNAPMPTLLADNRADGQGVFYADSAVPEVCAYEEGAWNDPPPDCVSEAPLGLAQAAGRPFVNASSPTLLQIQREVEAQLALRPPTPTTVPPSSFQPPAGNAGEGGEGLPAGAIAGIVIGSVAAVVALGLLAWRCCGLGAPERKSAAGMSNSLGKMSSISKGQMPSGKWSVNLTAGKPVHDTTTATDLRAQLPVPGADSCVQDRREFLSYQLDTLYGKEVLDGLVFESGYLTRAFGGQAVVQFAVHKGLKLDAAIKFFLHKVSFDEEVLHYIQGDDPLKKFLPKCYLIHDNSDSSFLDGHGRPMPPCIVMERGESLDRWVTRCNSTLDQFTCMQILHHICECLLDLHAAGYVHRDLKPGNIMWLPSTNRWTLIDFACAAVIGSVARAAYSLPYAAPEVVQAALREQQPSIVASTAFDAWSLGVLAVELFTGRPALVPFEEGKEQVVAKIVGDEKLPWEYEDRGRQLLECAGRFREAVLSLLHRDPVLRAMVQTFKQQYTQVMHHTNEHDLDLLSIQGPSTSVSQPSTITLPRPPIDESRSTTAE